LVLLLLDCLGQLIGRVSVDYVPLVIPEPGAPERAADVSVHNPHLPARPVVLHRGHDLVGSIHLVISGTVIIMPGA
jgi:hypothetical protein